MGTPSTNHILPMDVLKCETLEQYEKYAIVTALCRCNGNKKKAIAILGCSRSALYAKMKRHGILYKQRSLTTSVEISNDPNKFPVLDGSGRVWVSNGN